MIDKITQISLLAAIRDKFTTSELVNIFDILEISEENARAIISQYDKYFSIVHGDISEEILDNMKLLGSIKRMGNLKKHL